MRKTQKPLSKRLVGFFSLALVNLVAFLGFLAPVSATGAEANINPSEETNASAGAPATNSTTTSNPATGGSSGAASTPATTGSSCPEGSIPTSVLGSGGCVSDDGSGSGISDMLTTIANVMSVGVAIFAAIGIAVAGIQYLTAKGDEGQTRKAKQRLFEIVIGILAYVLIYALLVWLLPGFSGSSGLNGA